MNQFIPLTNLQPADHVAGERILIAGQRADGGAVATDETFFNADRAILFDLVQQVGINTSCHTPFTHARLYRM